MESAIEASKRRDHAAVRDLFFIGARSAVIAAAALALVVAIATLVAIALIVLQNHEASLSNPTGLAKVVAQGSSGSTLWPGWVAALFFALAVVRIRVGTPEPPAGRKAIEELSVMEIRHGLISEYRAVRIALVIVSALALVDFARFIGVAIAALHDVHWARTTVTFAGVECLGWILASIFLAFWALNFRGQLKQWGAV